VGGGQQRVLGRYTSEGREEGGKGRVITTLLTECSHDLEKRNINSNKRIITLNIWIKGRKGGCSVTLSGAVGGLGTRCRKR